MPLRLKKVKPSEIDSLHNIIRECGVDMSQRFGLSHWFPPYPIETMRQHASDRNVYAVYKDEELVATYTTGTHGWRHENSLWIDQSHKALYFWKLGVLPSRQGQGIGTWCVKQIEMEAAELGCQAIRFDAITAHTLLINYYKQLGYNERGNLMVKDLIGREWEVTIFEKII